MDMDRSDHYLLSSYREMLLQIRKATRKAQDRPLPPRPEGPTDSLAILLADRAER
jgi:hypothetical protein